MANAENGTVAAATEAASVAAAQTAAVVAAVETAADAAIEHAETRVEAAEQVAEQIADAALFTQLGQRVSDIDGKVVKWQNETSLKLSTLETSTAEMRNLMAEQSKTLTDLAAKVLTPPPPPPTPAANPPKATDVITEMPVEAVENAEAISENAAAPVVQTKKRVWR